MPSARRARSTLAVTVVGLLAAGLASSSAGDGSPAERPAPRACASSVAYASVARRVYRQAVDGPNLRDSIRRLERSRALADAVARDDPAATRTALRPLLRADVTRVVVTRGDRMLAAIGHAPSLAPAHGVIDDAAGTPVGAFRLSVLDDAGLAAIVHELTGAQVVLRTGSGVLDTTFPAGEETAGHPATLLRGTAFPSGPLSIALYTRAPCRSTASAIAAVGERLYRSERGGAQTAHVLVVVARDPRFIRAVATDDPSALRAQIIRFFRDPSLHVVRIRAVTANGTLVNDVGGPYVLAPASAPVRANGSVVGTVTLSIQDDTGYIKLMRRFTGAEAILRTPAGQVPGSSVSLGPLPDHGAVTVGGRSCTVSSFAAKAFPSDPLRISLLDACRAG
jgi:hypothetical protein